MTRAERGTGLASGSGSPVAEVAVLETEPLGHRLHYLAHLVAAAGPGRCRVLTTAAAAASEDYGLVSAALAEATRLLPGTGPTPAPADALAAAVEQARAEGVRLLVVPEADKYVVPLLRLLARRRLRGLRIRLLLLRTPAVGGPEPLTPATLAKPVLVQLLRAVPGVDVVFLTDAFGVVRRRRGYPGVRPVEDPVVPPEPGTPPRPEWLPAPADGTTLVGLFGVVTPRKNLPLLVAAVARTPGAVLVVAGRLDPQVRAFVASDPAAAALAAQERLVVVDRLLGADELAGALAGVDVVAVLHDNDSPSGILAEACARATPALVPAGGWLAEVADATGIGVACPLDVDGVAAGLARVRAEAGALRTAAVRAAGRLGTRHFTDTLLALR